MMKRLPLSLVAVLLMSTFTVFSQEDPTFYAENQTVAPGEHFCVDVKVRGFDENIEFVDVYISLNSSMFTNFDFQPSSWNGLDLSLIYGTNDALITWLNETEDNATVIPDDSILFTLCADAVGENGTAAPLTYFSSSSYVDVSDFEEHKKPLNFLHPTISINTDEAQVNTPSIDGGSLSYFDCEADVGENYLEVSGGVPPYTYQWSGPYDFSSTELIFYPSGSGDYSVTVTDQLGNIATADFYLDGYYGFPDIGWEVNPTCAQPYSGYLDFDSDYYELYYTHFLWSDGSTNSYLRGLGVGTYSVTLTNSSVACEEVHTFTLEEVPEVSLEQYCYSDGEDEHGVLRVEVICGLTPPLNLVWSTGDEMITDGMNDSLVLIDPIEDHYPYSVTVTDVNGETAVSNVVSFYSCHDKFGVVVHEQNRRCDGDASFIFLEVLPEGDYSFVWNTGDTTNPLTNLENHTDYRVTVTDVNTGNTIFRRIHYSDDLAIDLDAEVECVDGQSSIRVDVSDDSPEPLTYLWSTGETIFSDGDYAALTNVENGTYSLTVTNSEGCESSTSIDVLCFDDLTVDIVPSVSDIVDGEEVCFDFEVTDFTDMTSIQFDVKWRPYMLDFVGLSNFGIPGLTIEDFTIDPEAGSVSFSWESEGGISVTLPSGTSIFSVCLKAVHPGFTNVWIPDEANPTAVNIEHVNFDLQVNDEEDVYISSDNQTIPGELSVSTEYGQLGDEVCLEIRGKHLSSVQGMQFTTKWNPSELRFLSVDLDSSDLYGVSFTNFGSTPNNTDMGVLRFSWIHPSLNFSDLYDDVIFEVCFEVISPSGFRSVSIENNPTIVEIINWNGFFYFPRIVDGGIWSEEALVWPGDTDNNGVVNHFDLLNVGLGYGLTGPERSDIMTNWEGQAADNWEESTPVSLVNYKFSDTNGDGVIDGSDKDAIEGNWAETNDFWSGNPSSFIPDTIPYAASTPLLFVETYDIQVGETPTFDLVYGGVSQNEDTYGLAFTLVYDPSVVIPGSLDLSFVDSWLGIENTDFITVHHDNPAAGRIDMAITRIDGTPISGSGAIGQLSFQVVNTIPENDYRMYFGIENIRVIDQQEEEKLVVGLSTYATISGVVATQTFSQDFSVQVFPNPVHDEININTIGATVDRVELLDVNGQLLIATSQGTKLSTKTMEAGIYYLKIHTNKGIAFKRFVKI